jgi:hypothetical protein
MISKKDGEGGCAVKGTALIIIIGGGESENLVALKVPRKFKKGSQV